MENKNNISFWIEFLYSFVVLLLGLLVFDFFNNHSFGEDFKNILLRNVVLSGIVSLVLSFLKKFVFIQKVKKQ